MATGRPQCVCRKGFEGIPYSECRDVDECLNPVCGPNAQCINTLGGYDCQCRSGIHRITALPIIGYIREAVTYR